MENNNQPPKIFYAVSLGLEIGFAIALPMVLFLVSGVFLDKKLNTFPIFLISFLVLSFAAAIFEVRFLILPFLEKRSHDNKSNSNNTN